MSGIGSAAKNSNLLGCAFVVLNPYSFTCTDYDLMTCRLQRQYHSMEFWQLCRRKCRLEQHLKNPDSHDGRSGHCRASHLRLTLLAMSLTSSGGPKGMPGVEIDNIALSIPSKSMNLRDASAVQLMFTQGRCRPV